MSFTLTLASGSKTRQALLKNAGLRFDVSVPRIDEQSLKESLISENAVPRDVADALAEYKARAVARNTASYVIGADQVLAFRGSDPVETRV